MALNAGVSKDARFSSLAGHKGGLMGSFTDPRLRERVPEISTELVITPTSRAEVRDVGSLNGAHLLFHAVNEGAVSRDVWYQVWKYIYEKVRDYDSAHNEKYFYDLFPELNWAEGANALTKEKPPLANTTHYAYYFYAWQEFLFWLRTALHLLRLESLPISQRIGVHLKFSRLNTDLKTLRGMPLPKGIYEMVKSRSVLLAGAGPHDEIAVSVPFLITPGSGYFELTSELGPTALGPATWQFPSLPDLCAYGTFSLGDQGAADYVLGTQTDWDRLTTGSSTNPGMIARLTYINLIRARDNILTVFANSFAKEGGTWTRFFRDDLGLLEGEFDFTALAREIRSESPLDIIEYANANMAFARDVVGPTPGFASGKKTPRDMSLDPRALPVVTEGWDKGDWDLSARELYAYHYADQGFDLELTAQAVSPSYPYVGFVLKGENWRDHLESLFTSRGYYVLKSLGVDDIGLLNINGWEGNFAPFDFTMDAEAKPLDPSTWLGEDDPEISTIQHQAGAVLAVDRLLAIAGGLALNANASSDIKDAIIAFNNSQADWYLNPFLVEKGVVIPVWRVSPAHNPVDPICSGFFRCIQGEQVGSDLFATWYHDNVLIDIDTTVEDTARAHVAFEAGTAETDNVFKALKSTLREGLYFIGAGVWETPNTLYTMHGLTKQSTTFVFGISGAITTFLECLQILDHQVMNIPAVLVGYRDTDPGTYLVNSIQGYGNNPILGLQSTPTVPAAAITEVTIDAGPPEVTAFFSVDGDWYANRGLRQQALGLYMRFGRWHRSEARYQFTLGNVVNWLISNYDALASKFDPANLIGLQTVSAREMEPIPQLRSVLDMAAVERLQRGPRMGGMVSRREAAPESGSRGPSRKRRPNRGKFRKPDARQAIEATVANPKPDASSGEITPEKPANIKAQ